MFVLVVSVATMARIVALLAVIVGCVAKIVVSDLSNSRVFFSFSVVRMLLLNCTVARELAISGIKFSESVFFTCRHREERLHREGRLAWRVQAMVHPQRDTQADLHLLVGNLLIQVHTSQVFLDPQRQG